VTAAPAHPLTGPEAIEFALSRLNLDDLEAEQRKVITDKKKTARPRAVRILGILAGLRKNEVGAGDLMLKSVPVIPPQFRPFSVTGDTFLAGDANEHYRDLLEYRRLYQKTEEVMGRGGSGEVYGDLVKAVNATYGFGDSPNPKTKARAVKGFFETITGTSPKTGFFQSKMLSKPVDTVGRGVVIPDADYDMNEVGLPAEQAWKLYGSYIQRRLVRSGMAPAGALKHVKDRTPQALKALESEMAVRPVVLTRSPAWHKFNVQGLNPKLVDGDAIRVNTWITDGMTMDFDGDTGSVHLPSSDAAVRDVRERMMPDKMLWSIKDRDKVVPVPKHEQVQGLSLGAGNPLKNKHRFATNDDAMRAIESGQIDLNDDVDIGPSETPTNPLPS
jgi:DNA-directed RNA polymerase subunit beta'